MLNMHRTFEKINVGDCNNSFEISRYVLEHAVPKAVYAHFDECDFFAPPSSLTPDRKRRLEKAGVHIEDLPIEIDGRTFLRGHRLSCVNPSPETLRLISWTPRVRPRLVAVALDVIYESEHVARLVTAAYAKTLVQPWGRGDVVTFFGTTYTGQREEGQKDPYCLIAVYGDLACKVTGETACVHVEWRFSGLPTLRRTLLGTVEAMREFDFRAFFAGRLPLYTIDFGRLGLTLKNKRSGKRFKLDKADRTKLFWHGCACFALESLFEIVKTDDDGNVIGVTRGQSLQHFIQEHGRGDFLTKIDMARRIVPHIICDEKERIGNCADLAYGHSDILEKTPQKRLSLARRFRST